MRRILILYTFISSSFQPFPQFLQKVAETEKTNKDLREI